MVKKEQVLDALKGVMDPELHRSIVDLGMVREVQVAGAQVKVTIALTVPTCPMQDTIAQDAAQAVDALEDGLDVEITLTAMTEEEKAHLRQTLQSGQRRQEPAFPAANLNRVKTVIAVMSGKGGVGKSTVAAMLAVGLRRARMRVGVLDADITGPSIPKLLGVSEPPHTSPLGLLPTATSGGIKVMSINLVLQRPDDPVIWRGPMISSAIQQFWNDVFWGDLDTLVVDMPPGTSDAALTVMQALPVTGVVLVTSPQDLAEMVVRKAANMAAQLNVPLLGIVENMSYVVCPDCHARFELFGKGRSEEMAGAFGARFLGKIGLDSQMATLGDAGKIETYTNDEFAPLVTAVCEVIAATPEPDHHKRAD